MGRCEDPILGTRGVSFLEPRLHRTCSPCVAGWLVPSINKRQREQELAPPTRSRGVGGGAHG